MRQTIFVAALAALAATASNAENAINVIDRTDLRMQMFDEGSSRVSNNQFDVQYLRVDFKGNITDDMKYRLRLRLDKSSDKSGVLLKGIADIANYAYVEPKFNDMLSARIGKLWTYQGGWEIDNSSSDVYLLSGIDDVVNSYALGANPTLSFDKQKIQFVVTNAAVPYATDAKANKYFQYAVAYQGEIAGIQPLLSYSMTPATGWMKGVSVWAAGAKVDPKPIGGEIDVQGASNDMTKNEVLSFSGTVRYNAGAIRPQLKVLYDMNSNDGNEVTNVLGIAPAVEYYPYADTDFRVHLAYTGKNTSPKGGTSTYDQQIFLGIKGTWSMK